MKPISINGPIDSASPLRSRSVRRLVVVALLSLAAIYAYLRPEAYDHKWWQHVGHQRTSLIGNRRLMNAANPTDGKSPAHLLASHTNQRPGFKLVEGLDYFADYNVSAVELTEETPPANSTVYFDYIRPEDHPEYAMQYVSNRPRVLLIHDFMTGEECDAIIAASASRMERSKIAQKLDTDGNHYSKSRTSSNTWLPLDAAPVKGVYERILKLAGWKDGQSEVLQVLRYELSEKYNPHVDYFDPKMYGPRTHNRAVTVFLYLTDVEEGGETQFPRADGQPAPFNVAACEHGLRVRPRRGHVALFYDMKPWGQFDPYSLHGGCPVKQGVKWGGTLWLRVPFGGAN